MTRIDGSNPLATSRTGAGTGPQAATDRAAREAAQPGGSRGDGLQVSTRGRDVAAAAAAVQSGSDVRQEKVAALKASIANGSYQVDAGAIASRLLANGIAD